MARTKQQLAKDVLQELGILDALHDPSAEDGALVEARYDDKLAWLKDRGLAYWPNTSRTAQEIPSEVFSALVNIMAEDVAGKFGVPIPTKLDEHGRQFSCGTVGLRSLRVHIAKPASGEPTRAVYY